MEITEELLVALIARLIKVEASVATLASLSLQHMSAERDASVPFQTLAEVFADARARQIHNQIASFAVQFPQLGKLLQDHALVSESDLKEFLRDIARPNG
jgi:hypothetical protein